jgi:hypothetical protein
LISRSGLRSSDRRSSAHRTFEYLDDAAIAIEENTVPRAQGACTDARVEDRWQTVFARHHCAV